MTSPNDVIERLEAYAEQIAAGRGHFPTAARHLEEAASCIKTLREERDEAVAALVPFTRGVYLTSDVDKARLIVAIRARSTQDKT